MLSRRILMAVAVGAGAAWLAKHAWLRPSDHTASSPSRYAALAALCRDFRCPHSIAKACLRALPAIEGSPDYLAQLILAEMSSAGRDCTSPTALRQSIREQSRHDFDHGKVADVDGWMLSQTETRVYALRSLLMTDVRGEEQDGQGPRA
jgi:hypothetical protein